jgi:hypothetical protein
VRPLDRGGASVQALCSIIHFHIPAFDFHNLKRKVGLIFDALERVWLDMPELRKDHGFAERMR